MNNVTNKPTGGFPPIYAVSAKKTSKDNKNREFSSVPIKKIMESRRNNTPFFII